MLMAYMTPISFPLTNPVTLSILKITFVNVLIANNTSPNTAGIVITTHNLRFLL